VNKTGVAVSIPSFIQIIMEYPKRERYW